MEVTSGPVDVQPAVQDSEPQPGGHVERPQGSRCFNGLALPLIVFGLIGWGFRMEKRRSE
jgi:hypothetical protein